MTHNTKLIICSLVALIIGVASILPVAFFIIKEDLKPTVNIQQVFGDQSPFAFNLTYSYIGDYWNTSDTATSSYGWKYTVNYKTTPIIDMDAFPIRQHFAAFEYYALDVSTDKGAVATLAFSTYTYSQSYNRTLINYENQLWFNSNSSNRMHSSSNGQQGPMLSGLTGVAKGQVIGSASDWNISDGKPETIFLTVRRLGWVFLDGNSTIVHYGSFEPIVQVQLQNYGNGFLYNNLLTDDELAQINPVMPQFKYLGR